jgi:hypothetical protein
VACAWITEDNRLAASETPDGASKVEDATARLEDGVATSETADRAREGADPTTRLEDEGAALETADVAMKVDDITGRLEVEGSVSGPACGGDPGVGTDATAREEDEEVSSIPNRSFQASTISSASGKSSGCPMTAGEVSTLAKNRNLMKDIVTSDIK